MIQAAMIQPGLVLQNRYRVVQKLGEGGFGETFEVDDRGTLKVLKVLNLDRCSNLEKKQKALSSFRREAAVLMRLNHPGIPRVEPDGYFPWPQAVSEPFHCLVMEKVDGQNLEEWLRQRRNKPILQEQAIDWLKQLVTILDYLHQQHYFHRDIKPSNIMLKPDGQLVLIDFGTIRNVTNTYLRKFYDGEVTSFCSPGGYTPQEQCNGKAVPQSDFSSLGRTFVRLLTGKHPENFPEDDLTNKLIWRDFATQVSPPLADLIDWLIAPLPEERPENTQVILEFLEAITDGLPMMSQNSVVVSPTGLQGIDQLNTKNRHLKLSTTTRRALIGFGVAALATITALSFPKFTPLKPRAPASLANFSLVNTFSTKSEEAVAFSPNGQILASGGRNNIIQLWNWRIGKRLHTFPEVSSDLWSIAISPDGQLLASGHREGNTIKLWNLGTGKLLRPLTGHSNHLRSVAFSPDGQTLASGGADNTIKLWRVSTGELLHTFTGHTKTVTSVAFSSDGKTLASASDDETIKLWRLDTMKLDRPLEGHSGEVLSVAFSPDGQTLASSSADKTIKLWNPRTGELRSTLPGHSSWIWSVAFSPDGQYIASGSYDESIKLWNLRTGKELKTLTGHSGRVWSIAFNPDGQTLASSGDDGTVKIWADANKNGRVASKR
jgi:WD40 repeat protein/predicted Ser/Thr protein kinase